MVPTSVAHTTATYPRCPPSRHPPHPAVNPCALIRCASPYLCEPVLNPLTATYTGTCGTGVPHATEYAYVAGVLVLLSLACIVISMFFFFFLREKVTGARNSHVACGMCNDLWPLR